MDRHGKHKIAWIAAALSILLSSCGIPQATQTVIERRFYHEGNRKK